MKLSKRSKENIIAFIFVIVFVAFIVISMNYGPRARMIPIPVAIVSLCLIGLQIFLQNFKKDFDLSVDAADMFRGSKSGLQVMDEVSQEEIDDGTIVHGPEKGSEFWAFAIVLILMVLVLLFGLLASVFIFIVGFFVINAKMKWYKAIIYSVIFISVVYLLFGVVLRLHLYEGWIMSLILG